MEHNFVFTLNSRSCEFPYYVGETQRLVHDTGKNEFLINEFVQPRMTRYFTLSFFPLRLKLSYPFAAAFLNFPVGKRTVTDCNYSKVQRVLSPHYIMSFTVDFLTHDCIQFT